VSRTRYDAEHESLDNSGTAGFVRNGICGPVGGKAWRVYRNYWRLKKDRPADRPEISEFEHDLGLSLYAIREFAIIRWSSVFEIFAQCWALNMMLSRLERSEALTEHERQLARHLSPVHTPNRPPPGVPGILRCFEDVRQGLDTLPHVSTDPRTREQVSQPLHPELTTLRSIEFWRDYRNVLVHRGGRISADFVDRHRNFFERFRQNYESMRELKPTNRLQLPSTIEHAVRTTHIKAARWMNDLLVTVSGSHRGKLRGAMEEEPKLDFQQLPPPLLRDGDHSRSLEWIRNPAVRETFLTESRR
jgi:hypothetical protein